ncbi:DUF4307 domain-containing protein [Neomicrococcus lactis]|uniref:DUF4307 domain-containing protein n=1 Tax=Neomicrococcus lactis TaxID=732241 RepID=UPI002300C5A0|nr:DUF4307 domain-containing protein [Neomicrococcus lactis]
MNPQTHAPDTHGAQDSSLTNRYGTPKQPLSRRLKTTLVVAGLLLAVLAALWMSIANTDKFTSKDIAFNIQSPELVTVTFDLTRNVNDTVECSAQVLSEQKAIVGWKSVTFGPEESSSITTTPQPSSESISTVARTGDSITQRAMVNVRSSYQGVNGGVSTCWVLDK